MKSLNSKACTLALLTASGVIALLAQGPSQVPREQAWSILKAGVDEKNNDKRTAAVRALGLIPGDSPAVEMATRALGDAKPEVRAAAAIALGQMGSAKSIPSLRERLADADPSVVLAAAHALWTLKDPTAYEVYYAVLTGERKTGKGMVAEGMETLRDSRKAAVFGFEEGIGFIPFAGLGYSAVKALRKDDASPVRAGAAAVLANDPDPSSAEALVNATSDKSWVVRAAALDAIGKRGDPKLLNRIVAAMSDEKEAVQYTAAAAVIRLSDMAGSMKKPKNPKPIRAKKSAVGRK